MDCRLKCHGDIMTIDCVCLLADADEVRQCQFNIRLGSMDSRGSLLKMPLGLQLQFVQALKEKKTLRALSQLLFGVNKQILLLARCVSSYYSRVE